MAKATKKRLTIRVDIITKGDYDTTTLASNLKTIVSKDSVLKRRVSNIKVHSLAPRSDLKLCATVSLNSSLKGPNLCQRLQQKQGSFGFCFTSDFEGITPLHDVPDGAEVDIIAVPGLGSHALGSWKSSLSEDVWLRDFLPANIPKSRVLLYGYDTTLLHSQSKQSIHDLGSAFLMQITNFRFKDKTLSRPILFIGHSLGGLLVKEALVIAHQKSGIDNDSHSLLDACCGVLFFGVPHLGLQLAQLKTLVCGQPNEALITDIIVTPNAEPSTFLKGLARQFSASCKGRFRVVSFYETELSPTLELDARGNIKMTGPSCLLVTTESATTTGLVTMLEEDQIPLNTDHSGLVKFNTSVHPNYDIVAGRIGTLVDKAVSRIHERAATPNLRLPHKDTRACLRSLAFESMDFRRQNIDNAEVDTFQWLLSHDTFLQWMKLQRGLLWIKGKPGAGKSTLMKFARRNVPRMIAPGTIVLIFFFHGRGAELQKTALGLFRSFLFQLLEKVPDAVADLVEFFAKQTKTRGKYGEKWHWHEHDLQDSLREALSRTLETFPVVIFVDALDECGQEPAADLIDYFERLLEDLPSTPNCIRILFSCRHCPILSLDAGLTIDLGKENQDDIEKFVWNRLSAECYSVHIKQVISCRANGVFLWARLAVERVCLMTLNAESPRVIEAKISNIPGDLRELYRGLLEELTEKMPDHTQTALRLMLWVCFAQSPLTLEEIQWAIAVAPDCAFESLDECRKAPSFITRDQLEKRISTLSCGLVEVVKVIPDYYPSRRSRVQFIHQSVKDFLLETGLSSLGALAPIVPIANYQLGLSCLQYIRLFGPKDEINVEIPLVYYAAHFWNMHLHFGHPEEGPFEDIFNLLRPMTPLLESLSRNDAEVHHDDRIPFVHLAVKEDLVGLLSWMLSNADTSESVVKDQNSEGKTAIHIAACNGNDLIMDLIIKSGKADLNVKDNLGRTPLSHAALNSPECTDLLIKTGEVDVDVKDKAGWTPVFHAVCAGCSACLDLLLETGEVDVNIKAKSGHTPLMVAAMSYYSDTGIGGYRSFKSGRVDINSKDDEGQTPLWYVARTNSVSVAQLLLRRREIEIDDKDNIGRTALSHAADKRNSSILKLLLETGKVDIDSRDNNGRTPLSHGAEKGQKEVVKLLIDTNSVDVDSRDNNGCTPLSYAADSTKSERTEVVKLLIDTNSVDVDSRDNNGRTPLSYAAESGRTEVVKLLIDTDRVDVDSRDNNGCKPLSYAAESGRTEVVKLLIDTDRVDVDSRDDNTRTPLSYAAEFNKASAVRLLIDTDRVDVNSKDTDGRTPLSYAADRARGPDIRLILEAGKVRVKRNEVGDEDSRALSSLASDDCPMSAIQLLLETGTVDVDSEDKYGWTPVDYAAGRLGDEMEERSE